MNTESYDVAVIGAGHAGIEAATAAAKLGVKTVLFTLSLDALANLPCNPSIGGTAKGHLVREIDALGGCMGIAADATFLQSRMLNKGKGPAVHSLRVQTDRSAYHTYMKKMIENIGNIELKQDEITEIILKNKKVCGIKTKTGAEYTTQAVIIATGTYLNGRIHIGETNYTSGPDNQMAPTQLTSWIKNQGISMYRFKTGTPARVHKRSIDFTKLGRQQGDEPVIPFSFMTEKQLHNQVDCYIAYTNLYTHEIIQKNLHRSPLYGGNIEGIGPRYCPSIEDKIVRFSDKDRHQLFVEPCGLDTQEMYIQGLSTSMPLEVQEQIYKSIEGFENLEIMRPAYAIEYDCIDPLQLKPTLEFLDFEGLYSAGQFNGTSGYEEAAAQGLLAGINASRKVQNKSQIVLQRQQSYIGTLIDDLVTKGVSDPYRMMTSRSEYRLYLRQDNADERLTPLGRNIGLVDDVRWKKFTQTITLKTQEIDRLNKTFVSPQQVNPIIEKLGEKPIKSGISLANLLKRPSIQYHHVALLMHNTDKELSPAIKTRVEIEIKYEGYIKRQMEQVEASKKSENTTIPANIQYNNLSGLRLEAREKLLKIRPLTIGQASRIPGVSPSDIAQLMLYLEINKKKHEKEISKDD